MGGLEAKWVYALARRLLRHRNPAARKAFLQRLLDHAAPAEVADWPLVRDAVLPALDDNELRKSRDVARRCDAAAVNFVARFYIAAPEETRAAVVPTRCAAAAAARARGALEPFEDVKFAALPSPRIQDDDVAAAAAAREAAGNDAATHALALAVVPLVSASTSGAATAGGRAASCTHAIADEETLEYWLAIWLASRVTDAGAIDARGGGRRGGDVATDGHGFRVQAAWSGPPVAVTDARGSQRRSLGVGPQPW